MPAIPISKAIRWYFIKNAAVHDSVYGCIFYAITFKNQNRVYKSIHEYIKAFQSLTESKSKISKKLLTLQKRCVIILSVT